MKSDKIVRLTEAEVDLSRLCGNYNKIKAAASVRIICIVKADAYGHGALRCSAALRECGADFFGTANLDEAVRLRRGGIEGDIIILGYTPPENAPLLAEHNIIQTVFSPQYANDLSCCLSGAASLRCHMKIDTGMNRLGFRAGGHYEQMAEAIRLPRLDFCGIYTHFACADTPSSPMTRDQYARFNDTVEALASLGVSFETRHVSNSAAIVNFPEMKLDAVRAGIILYGLRPSRETGTGGCVPVMTLRTTVSHIHDLRAGESVSYGASYTADRPLRLATLTIGYADGFVRSYAGGGVYIAGKRAPIVGRICMDQCLADITGIEGVYPGMRAVVFDGEHTADLIAEAGGTINYEVTSILTPRVKRVYK
ncbi:MAG: alanine racemase [Eubacteriales bacterium]|nr:alanine racemase [Eubacteriales bacterium]